ncbi:MAG: fructosamine kinase family protein [Kineosporiaceae bacterium]
MTGATFVKRRPGAPAGMFAAEAAGLRWLGSAGAVAVAAPLEVSEDALVLPRIAQVAPSRASARAFGTSLAALHAAGAAHVGAPPTGWDADGFVGPLPLPHVHDPSAPEAEDWGTFYARLRLRPYLRRARDLGSIDADGEAVLGAVCARLEDGDRRLTGPVEPPARLHGDLWAGNVLWSAEGAVLIDPAAHGGHRETDLAMLALFGLPHLDAVLAAYTDAAPLTPGWRQRVAVHQLHPLLVHAVLFGRSYGAQAVAVARGL